MVRHGYTARIDCAAIDLTTPGARRRSRPSGESSDTEGKNRKTGKFLD